MNKINLFLGTLLPHNPRIINEIKMVKYILKISLHHDISTLLLFDLLHYHYFPVK